MSWGPREGLLPASGTSALVSGVDPSPGPGSCRESNEAPEGHPRPTPCPAKLWETLWPPVCGRKPAATMLPLVRTLLRANWAAQGGRAAQAGFVRGPRQGREPAHSLQARSESQALGVRYGVFAHLVLAWGSQTTTPLKAQTVSIQPCNLPEVGSVPRKFAWHPKVVPTKPPRGAWG